MDDDTHRTLRRADAARAAGRRMIARGERPLYRIAIVRTTPDILVRVVELPWLDGRAPAMREVTGTGRALIAAWLDVHPESFDVAAA
jgi:hypothetical protein